MNVHRTLAYLAQPYWHESQAIREQRIWWGAGATAYLLSHGKHIFSPISHAARVREHLPSSRAHDFWLDYDATVFARCDFLLLLPLHGWEESPGVAEEMGWARSQDKPIFQLTGDFWVPQSALLPSPILPKVHCDQFGPRQFPEFTPERTV